jgi:divalent metal cation (Fe/Co/Zn/Cd) transporter
VAVARHASPPRHDIAPARKDQLRSGLRLEYLSLAYNLLEAAVGVAAGLAAASVALVGFGLDSVVESSSAAILTWRLAAEQRGARSAEEVERRAVRFVAVAFFALAAYVGARGLMALATQSEPEQSTVGLVLAAVSLVVMPLLARLKRNKARELNSRALEADSRQTTLCTYLSAFLLVGLGANAALGWWWADPVAGLAIAGVAVREGLELWREQDFCCV